jgi:hypothetical protein
MSTFNQKTRGANTTLNHEGAVAYTLTPKLELYSAVVTSMMAGDKFYEKKDDTLNRIRKLVAEVAAVDPSFVAKLAVYAREQMHLRSVPLVLLVELDKVMKGSDKSDLRKAVVRAIQRPDEMTELLAYFGIAHKLNGTKKIAGLSKALKNGIAQAFTKFDEYQLQKYNRDGAVKLRDVLFLSHAKPTSPEQAEMWKRLIANELATPETWETKLSAGGDKTRSWSELIDGRKMGYMATLRNLRNILEANVSPEHIQKVIALLTNKEAVLKSKLFPFRFYAAAKELESVDSLYTSLILSALDTAMQHAAANIKGFNSTDRIHVSVDTSGSMSATLSDKSKMRYQDVGLVMGMLLQEVSPMVETSIFGTTYKRVNLTKGNILGNTHKLAQYSDMVGSSTNGYLVPQDLLDRKIVVDRVAIFTDCQLYNDQPYFGWGQRGPSFDALWKQYRKEVAPNAKLYIFDLAGYGNTPVSVKGNGVHLISGWSEKVFDIIEAYENGSSAVKAIEEIIL